MQLVDVGFGLFSITRDFDMQTQPHLLLLQKTMVMVEGVARTLDPDINLWDVSAPFVREWIRTELHGAAGADTILKRMAQGPGHELHADGERPDATAHDCCNMTVVADGCDADGAVVYRIRQNQVGGRPVTLARGLTLEAARDVVLAFEFDASLERHEPRDWPDGVCGKPCRLYDPSNPGGRRKLLQTPLVQKRPCRTRCSSLNAELLNTSWCHVLSADRVNRRGVTNSPQTDAHSSLR